MDSKPLGVCAIVINSGGFDAYGDISKLTRGKMDKALDIALAYQHLGKPYLYIFPHKPLSFETFIGLGEAMRVSIILRDTHCKDILIMESMKDLFSRNELISYLQQNRLEIVEKVVIA